MDNSLNFDQHKEESEHKEIIRFFLGTMEEAVEGGDGSEESPEFQCYKYLPRREFPVSLIQHTS